MTTKPEAPSLAACHTALLRCRQALAEAELHIVMGHDPNFVQRQLGPAVFWVHACLEAAAAANTHHRDGSEIHPLFKPAKETAK